VLLVGDFRVVPGGWVVSRTQGLEGPGGDPLGRDEGSSAVGLDRSKVPVGAISYIV
jgi:hypothetical protein